MADHIIPFDPSIPKDEAARLFRKLADTRLPEIPIVPDAGDDYGPSLEWINKLYNHWLHEFSWEKAQAEISEWHHFTTSIENMKVHFIHEKARTRQNEAIPLLLVHGWPGTFFEFQNVMHPLLDPQDPKAPVFDLVIPSLPGFCWSQGPPRDWTLQDTARMYNVLMHRLGYPSYAAQAGDWGHWVIRELGSGRYPSCKAVHTNMCPGAPPTSHPLTPTEQAALHRAQSWLGHPLHEAHMAYAIAMRTRPHTLGTALNDNPVALMLFLGEKYNELADPHSGTAALDNPRFNHDVCATLCLYFFTPPSILTSMLCYYNNVRHEVYAAFNAREENLIRVPLGVSTFAFDAFPVSRAGAETTTTNLRFFRERESGGHFACMECPEEMVGDMREFFGEFYQG